MMKNTRTMRALQAAAGMIVLAIGWQILSMVFPHYLFPPVPEIISRTVEVLITGSLLVDVLLTGGPYFWRTVRRVRSWRRSGDGYWPVENRGEFLRTGTDLFSGHSGAVLGGVCDYLVSRHRISCVVHHDHDHAARVHLPDSRRFSLDVEGPVRDDHVVSAVTLDVVSLPDRTDHRAGHTDRLEGQPRQRRARCGGRRTGGRHRRRRLSASCASSNCSTWPAPWPGRCSSCCSCWSCSRSSPRSRTGPCAIVRCPSGPCDR